MEQSSGMPADWDSTLCIPWHGVPHARYASQVGGCQCLSSVVRGFAAVLSPSRA